MADRIHVRALAVDDGQARAVLVSVDVIGIETGLWREVARRVELGTGISPYRLLLFASRTHSVPGELAAGFVDAIVAAVHAALAALRPARLAVGTGECHINVNRNLFDPVTHQWREGRNDQGPSDKTVTVLHFSEPDGAPVAVLCHYAVHAVVTGLLDLISGDIPGAASAHLDEALGHGVVALWSSGCAGDQNPAFYQQTLDLRALRIAEHAARGVDISNEMPAGGVGLDREDTVVQRLMTQQRAIASALGVVLAEEVLAVARDRCDRPRTGLRLAGEHRVVHSPGRRRTDSGRAGRLGTYGEDAPVPLRVGLCGWATSPRLGQRRALHRDRSAVPSGVAREAQPGRHALQRAFSLGVRGQQRRGGLPHLRGAVEPPATRPRRSADRRHAPRGAGRPRTPTERGRARLTWSGGSTPAPSPGDSCRRSK